MEISKIDDNIFQFIFTKESSDFSLNILALLSNDTAVLIDLAYESQAAQVKNYLEKKGISKFVLFISHHHEDHFDGIKSFPNAATFGSGDFKNDFQEHLQSDKLLKSFTPTIAISDGEIFNFGNFEIKTIYTPGHNKCGFSFLINNKHLYAGDLIFFAKTGLPSLPYIDANSTVQEYIDTLTLIKNINFDCLIMGHGSFVNDRKTINKLLEDHLFYLKKICSANENVSIESYLPDESNSYSGLKFHANNILAAQR